jgi:ketosteroid isomerase-like protein
MPTEVALAKFPSGDSVQTLTLIEDDEASAAEQAGDKWLTPALQKKLQERGAAVMKRLEGFHTLTPVQIAVNSNGDPQPTKLGELTLTTQVADDETLTLMLRDGSNKLLQRERIETYSEGDRGEIFGNAPCNYRPSLNGAYRDPAKRDALYIEVGYRYPEGCGPTQRFYLSWTTDPHAASPEAQVAELVGTQFDVMKDDGKLLPAIGTADMLVIDKNSVVTMNDFSPQSMPGNYDGHDDHDTAIELSRDGTSAWASTLTHLRLGDLKHGDMSLDLRASDVLVKTPKGWRIAAFAWTEAMPNATANRDAKARKLVAGKLAADPGDAGLRDVFAKMTTEGLKNVAPDLVAIGSGPGERTVGGPGFAKAWNAAWKGKTTIVSSVARMMPSGTTGWVTSTIELAKTGYKIPFTVLCVFDKAADGSWTLVHIHFAT